MALYLVQHGLSVSKDVDPEKDLSPDGIAEIQRIAKIAGKHQIRVAQIRHSGKKRAAQTADILAHRLAPPQGVVAVRGINPLDDVPAVGKTIDSTDNIMLVGHLPFMERLASFLVTGSIEAPVCKFQNGGIVCLDKTPETSTWFIKWMLLPNFES